MVLNIQKADCCGCYACANICPKNCIVMAEDSEGFWYPQVDEAACVECGLCEKVCPALHGVPETTDTTPAAYAAKNKDDATREASSSGGVFSLLAEETLASGGVVFGAALSEDCREVRHIAVERADELAKLRGSKYVQSRIGETYAQAKAHLDVGRAVLFSGTPCQIEGLRAFLRKDYDHLLCVDIACHGVPSPKAWRRYLDARERQAADTVRQVSFRDKQTGWRTYSVHLNFASKTDYSKKVFEDPYMQAFLQNICLRPSCTQCHFKKLNRVSDLTLADFWGIEQVLPEMDDDRGTSLVLIHSEKGKAAFDAVAARMDYKEISAAEALRFNSAATASVAPHPEREAFFRQLDEKPFDKLAAQYTASSVPLKVRVASALKKAGLWDTVQRLRGRE